MVLTTPKLTLDQAKASMKPITDFASSLGNLALNNEVATANSYLDYYNKVCPQPLTLADRPSILCRTKSSVRTANSSMTDAVL